MSANAKRCHSFARLPPSQLPGHRLFPQGDTSKRARRRGRPGCRHEASPPPSTPSPTFSLRCLSRPPPNSTSYLLKDAISHSPLGQVSAKIRRRVPSRRGSRCQITLPPQSLINNGGAIPECRTPLNRGPFPPAVPSVSSEASTEGRQGDEGCSGRHPDHLNFDHWDSHALFRTL